MTGRLVRVAAGIGVAGVLAAGLVAIPAHAAQSHVEESCELVPRRLPAPVWGDIPIAYPYDGSNQQACHQQWPKIIGQIGYHRYPRNIQHHWVLG